MSFAHFVSADVAPMFLMRIGRIYLLFTIGIAEDFVDFVAAFRIIF
jgi:esterase/lipase superfamily enzyme